MPGINGFKPRDLDVFSQQNKESDGRRYELAGFVNITYRVNSDMTMNFGWFFTFPDGETISMEGYNTIDEAVRIRRAIIIGKIKRSGIKPIDRTGPILTAADTLRSRGSGSRFMEAMDVIEPWLIALKKNEGCWLTVENFGKRYNVNDIRNCIYEIHKIVPRRYKTNILEDSIFVRYVGDHVTVEEAREAEIK